MNEQRRRNNAVRRGAVLRVAVRCGAVQSSYIKRVFPLKSAIFKHFLEILISKI